MNPNQKEIISSDRKQQIYALISRLNVKKIYIEFIQENELFCLEILNEALTHTSRNQRKNHERLEFLGDAVLRLAASEHIQENFPSLKVGDQSELRAHMVSDAWLAEVGERINIKEGMLIGTKAYKDHAAAETIKAEGTEALIGALYECLNNLDVIHNWLSPYWKQTSKKILADPHRLNSKSALQEWSQGKGFKTPIYKTEELSTLHGDQKRFYCEVLINQEVLGKGWGSSRKQSEKEAALLALESVKKSN
ncbi:MULTISPECIES: ribonuclease III [Prochlorococcus]|uniref:ribonuclease III n=1 Tax=Prochlorococcus TaxID=1218 RepID=UPI000533B6F9|nr:MULTISPECIES: ribonuclease III [Prochlorococcus]KGG13631.1 Ribonuclease III [Prochlorococcus sp. MIT 0601]